MTRYNAAFSPASQLGKHHRIHSRTLTISQSKERHFSQFMGMIEKEILADAVGIQKEN